MPEGARRHPESYKELGLEPEDLDEYIGDAAARLFELQAEKAQMEGRGASKKELAETDREIRSLQKLIKDNERAYRQKAQEAKVIPFPSREPAATRERIAQKMERLKGKVREQRVAEAGKRVEAQMAEEIAASEARAEAAKKREKLKEIYARTTKTESAAEAIAALPTTEEFEKGKIEARDMKEADAAAAEFRARLEARKQAREAAEKELMNQLVSAMEAGPTAREEEAAPPENLPVAEAAERPSYPDILAKADTYRGLTKKGREGMMAIVARAAAGETVSAREQAMLTEQYPGWTQEDFQTLKTQLERPAEFKKEITELATQKLVEEPTARIDALREKVRKIKEEAKAERERITGGTVAETEVEERFFEQGSRPEELAKRERAQELYPAKTPDEALRELRTVESMSTDDWANEDRFTRKFLKSVERDPAHRISPDVAKEYAAQYWKLLQKDNERLAEAMKPQPKVGFFRRLFGGAPKPKQVMTPQEMVQFQKMDKMVREIMERPGTSARGQALRSTSGRTSSSGYIGIGRGRPS